MGGGLASWSLDVWMGSVRMMTGNFWVTVWSTDGHGLGIGTGTGIYDTLQW